MDADLWTLKRFDPTDPTSHVELQFPVAGVAGATFYLGVAAGAEASVATMVNEAQCVRFTVGEYVMNHDHPHYQD